jgi:hypothetical protein
VQTTFQITVGAGSVIPPEPLIHPARGHFAGHATAELVPGPGPLWHLNGKGHFQDVGHHVTLTGTLQGATAITQDHARGTLTLSRGDSTLVLDLQGPAQASFSPLPHSWTYTVTSATGKFQDVQSQGTLELVLKPKPKSATHATFTLTF